MKDHGTDVRPAGPGFSPLAERLQLGPGSASPWLAHALSWLGAELPFARATALFQHVTGSTLSHSTLRRTTLATARAVRLLEPVAPALDPPVRPMQLSVDGSMLAIIGEGWREVRVASLGVVRADPDPNAPGGGGTECTVRTTELSYVAALCDAQTFQDLALPEVWHRGLDRAPQVASVSDGAPWIQDFVDYHCPQAVRILDFAHAAGYLAVAAQASFGPGTAATSEWFATQRHELRHGDPDRVLAALADLPTSEERDTALRYLSERRTMIGYRELSEAGWPIGGGCVESAHKHVLQVRMKGPGMRWRLGTAQAMIALRVTLANGRWAAVWPHLAPRQRQVRRERSATRRRARQPLPAPPPARPPAPPPSTPPAPARPKLVSQGRPTADHPWRRRLSFFPPRPPTKM